MQNRETNITSKPTQNPHVMRKSQNQQNQQQFASSNQIQIGRETMPNTQNQNQSINQNFVNSKLITDQQKTMQDLIITKNQTEQDQKIIEELREEIITLRNTINEYEQLLDSERNTILFLQNQISSLNNAVSLKNDDLNNKSRRIIELERELDESQKRQHDLLQYQDSQQNLNLNFQGEIQKNQQDAKKLEADLKNKDKIIADLQKKLQQQKAYQEEVQKNFKNDYQQLMNEKNDLKRENYENRNQLGLLLAKHNDLTNQYQNLQSFHDQLKDDHRAQLERAQLDFQNDNQQNQQNDQANNPQNLQKQQTKKSQQQDQNVSNRGSQIIGQKQRQKENEPKGSQILQDDFDNENSQYGQFYEEKKEEKKDEMNDQTKDYLLIKIKRLEDEINELKNQKQKIEGQQSEGEKEKDKIIDDLNKLIRQMQMQERQQMNNQENFESENADKINQLMRQLYESQSQNQKLTSEVSSLQQLKNKMGEQVDRLTSGKSGDLKELERQINEYHQKLLKYENEIAKQLKKINSLNFDLKYRDDMFRQKYEDMQTLLNIKVTEAANLKEMLDRQTLEAKNHHICEQKITALSTENGAIKQETIQRRKIIEDLKSDRQNFEKQRDQDIKDAITQTKNNMKLLADKEIRDVKVKYDEKIDEYLLQIEKLKSDLKYQTEKNQELRDDNENIGKNLSKYNQQAEEWRMRYTEVRRDNILPQSLQNENEELQRQIDDQKEIIFRLQKDLDELQNGGQDQDKMDQEKQVRDKDTEIDYLRQLLKQKEQEVQEKEKFAQQVKIENSKILDNNIGAKDAIKGQQLIWQKEKKDLEQLIQQLRGDVMQSKSSVTMAYGQNTEQIKKYEQQIRQMEQDIIILRDGNDEAYEIIHQLEEQISKQQFTDPKNDDDQKQDNSLQSSYDKLVTDVAILKKTMFQIDIKNDQLTKENERLRELQQKYNDLERQNDKLKIDLKLYTEKGQDQYYGGNDINKRNTLNIVSPAETEKANLLKQNQEQQKTLNDLKNQLQKAQQEKQDLVQLMRENKEAELVINKLKKELRDQQELINKMKQQIQNLQNDLKKEQKENQNLQSSIEQQRIQIETTLKEKNLIQSQIDDIQFQQLRKTNDQGGKTMAFQMQGLEKQLQEYQRDRQLLNEMRKDYEILGNELLERDKKIKLLQDQMKNPQLLSSYSNKQQFENDLNDWMKKETFYREKILELEDHIEKLMTQIQINAEKTNQFNIQISDLMRQIQIYERMKIELDDYKRKCEQFSIQINNGLRSSLQGDPKYEYQLEQLKLSLVKQQKEYELRIDEYKAKIVTLEAQLVFFKEKNEEQKYQRIETGSTGDKYKLLLMQAEKDCENWRLKYFSLQEQFNKQQFGSENYIKSDDYLKYEEKIALLQSEIQRLEILLNQPSTIKSLHQININHHDDLFQNQNSIQKNLIQQNNSNQDSIYSYTKQRNVQSFNSNQEIENLRIQNKILEDKNAQISNMNNQFTNLNYSSYSQSDANKMKNNLSQQQLRFSSNQGQMLIRQPESTKRYSEQG